MNSCMYMYARSWICVYKRAHARGRTRACTRARECTGKHTRIEISPLNAIIIIIRFSRCFPPNPDTQSIERRCRGITQCTFLFPCLVSCLCLQGLSSPLSSLLAELSFCAALCCCVSARGSSTQCTDRIKHLFTLTGRVCQLTLFSEKESV